MGEGRVPPSAMRLPHSAAPSPPSVIGGPTWTERGGVSAPVKPSRRRRRGRGLQAGGSSASSARCFTSRSSPTASSSSQRCGRHGLCFKYGLAPNTTALITSGCGLYGRRRAPLRLHPEVLLRHHRHAQSRACRHRRSAASHPPPLHPPSHPTLLLSLQPVPQQHSRAGAPAFLFKKAAPERRLSSAGMSGDLEGVTVLAWGAQVPDCLASISMAKKGLGPGPARRGRVLPFC